MTGKKYIYNISQSNFYMERGIICRGTGVHHTTGKVFHIFNWEDTVEVFKEWLNVNNCASKSCH